MQIIKTLSDSVIAKIAAGEVIERPAYAIKELIENALDAHANGIEIILENGGLNKISVHDNGEGMSREDILICFKPHTTSKIHSEAELVGIKTLGFRGEALASIVAVSETTIQSRQEHDSSGTQVILRNALVDKILPVGMPCGTTVIVESLFHNFPARKNFLVNPTNELRIIMETVTALALANPLVRMQLTHNGKELLNLPAAADLSQRVKTIVGSENARMLLPAKYEDAYISITGFIGSPQLTSQSAHRQWLFINQRWVKDKLITTAIKESYDMLLAAGAQPVYIVFLTVPYELVDVNVHPRKEQVSFTDKEFIFTHMHTAITETFLRHNITDANMSWAPDVAVPTVFQKPQKITKTVAATLLKKSVLPWVVGSRRRKAAELVQLHNVYIVTETENGILLIDQHAAHERVLYEKYRQAFLEHKARKQTFKLAQAIRIDLTPTEMQTFIQYRTIFETIGFTLIPTSPTTAQITHLPVLFKDRPAAPLVLEILTELQTGLSPADIDAQSRRMLAFLACRSAIKAGDRLSKQECRSLLSELEHLDLAYTCPHGRPISIELPLPQVDLVFKRR